MILTAATLALLTLAPAQSAWPTHAIETDFLSIRMVRAEEKTSVPSYRRVDSQDPGAPHGEPQLNNRHVLKLIFKFMTGPDYSGASSGAAGAGGSDPTPLQPEGSGVMEGAGTVLPPPPPPPSGGGFTSGRWYFMVLTNHEIGPVSSAPSRAPFVTLVPVGPYAGQRALVHEIDLGDEIAAHYLPAPGTGSIKIVVGFYMVDPLIGPYWSMFQSTEYGVTKNLCGDSAIDSRRTFGQPNLEGQLPGDPNAESRNVQFGGWQFKGGLFVGNMGIYSGDQSGRSRITIFPLLEEGVARMVVLTMLRLGSPSNANSSVQAGIYIPRVWDQTIPPEWSSENLITWDNQWPISPRATTGSPPSWDSDPFRKVQLGGNGVPDLEYANWQLTTVRDSDTAEGTKTIVETPRGAMQRLSIAVDNDQAWAAAGGQAWHYFGSKEYQTLQNAFPLNDCAPRLWIVQTIASVVQS